MIETENTNDNDLISALHDDLQKLQESLTPALHSDAHFGELKDTLNSIAERISAVEGNLTDMKEIANSAPIHSPDVDYQQVEARGVEPLSEKI